MKRLIDNADSSEEILREKYLRSLASKECKEIERVVETIDLWARNLCLEEVHILAVGSSTFSAEYWDEMARIKEAFSQVAHIPEEYRDLNLRVLFTQSPHTRKFSIRGTLAHHLRKVGYSPTLLEATQNKGHIVQVTDYFDPLGKRMRGCTVGGIQCSYRGVEVLVRDIKPIEIYTDFVSASIKRRLSPHEHLKWEREHNHSFSLLYSR